MTAFWEDFQRFIDTPLAPWQADLVEALVRGDHLVFTYPRRGGRSAFQDQMTKAYERPRGTSRPPIVIYDEMPAMSTGSVLRPVDVLLRLCLEGLTPRSASPSPALQGYTLEV